MILLNTCAIICINWIWVLICDVLSRLNNSVLLLEYCLLGQFLSESEISYGLYLWNIVDMSH